MWCPTYISYRSQLPLECVLARFCVLHDDYLRSCPRTNIGLEPPPGILDPLSLARFKESLPRLRVSVLPSATNMKLSGHNSRSLDQVRCLTLQIQPASLP